MAIGIFLLFYRPYAPVGHSRPGHLHIILSFLLGVCSLRITRIHAATLQRASPTGPHRVVGIENGSNHPHQSVYTWFALLCVLTEHLCLPRISTFPRLQSCEMNRRRRERATSSGNDAVYRPVGGEAELALGPSTSKEECQGDTATRWWWQRGPMNRCCLCFSLRTGLMSFTSYVKYSCVVSVYCTTS